MTQVSYLEGAWTAPNTQRAFSYRLWKGIETRALVVLIHGFGEHSSRYQPFTQALAGQGICVAAHGCSSGVRGDVDVHQCVSDMLVMMVWGFFISPWKHVAARCWQCAGPPIRSQ